MPCCFKFSETSLKTLQPNIRVPNMKLTSRFLLPLLLYYFCCHTGNTYSEEQVNVDIRGQLALMLCMQYNFEGNFSKSPPKPHKYPLYDVKDVPCRIIRRRICGGATDCQKFRSSYKRPCDEEANLLECETDMHLEADKNSSEQRAGNSEKSRRWPNRTYVNGKGVSPKVPYEVDRNIGKDFRGLIFQSMLNIEFCTCIRFEYKQPVHKDWVFITNKESGCFVNHIGRPSGQLKLNLGKNCDNFGIVIHELVHAIGFRHEQSRPDRDQYVTILEENIKPDYVSAFRKMSTSEWESFREKYDYKSIMHYGKSDFAKKPGLITIQTKDPKAYIGQRIGLSRSDIIQIQRMYQCSERISGFCTYVP